VGFSQIQINIGNPIDTNVSSTLKRKPLGSFYGYERSSLIVKSNEIGLSGGFQLSKIEFLCDTLLGSSATTTPLRIFISETNDSLFSTPSTVSTEVSNATLVFNGTISSSSFTQGNYISHVLNSPFVYSGISNLKITIETNAGGNGNESALAKGFAYSIADSIQFQYWQQDYNPPTGTGTLQKLRPVCRLSFDTATVCNGNPNPGTTLSSKSEVCPSESFLLSLGNSLPYSGINFQWQSSNDSINWNSIAGASSQNYTSVISVPTYFRCLVNCNSFSDTSIATLINLKPGTECYCTNLGGGCQGFSIDSISILELQYSNSSPGCANTVQAHYSSFDLSSLYNDTLIAGQTYQLSTKFTGDNVAGFWIDFDRDGYFENYEFNSICSTSVTGTVYTKSFNIPIDAVNGQSVIRIRTRNKIAGMDSSMACTSFGSGETEDYKITLAGGQNMGISKTEIENASHLIFPNPSKEKFNIQFKEAFSGKIILRDLSGKMIKEFYVNQKTEYVIDLYNIENGFYLLQFRSETKDSFSRIIKQ
jgi:hypothetical protein